jgi:hypothetical protein
MTKRGVLCAVAVSALVSSPAWAASHLWVVNEIFSNPDGTIQFIELHVPCTVGCGAENSLNLKWVKSVSTNNQENFTANVPGNTSLKYLLLGTQAFADLPGAPTPDYIIVDNFFNINGDEILYWTYNTGDLMFDPGELPTDGILSLNRNGTTGTNSPTNYAGQSGSVDASPNVPAASTWGLIAMLVLLAAGGAALITRRAKPAVA